MHYYTDALNWNLAEHGQTSQSSTYDHISEKAFGSQLSTGYFLLSIMFFLQGTDKSIHKPHPLDCHACA